MTKKGLYKGAVAEAAASGAVKSAEDETMVLYEYPDYETYRKVQEDGNKAKLKRQFVRESHIERLAEAIRARLPAEGIGLCHGTRAGREQAWFATYLTGREVWGTEISETATQFPMTVQWDFHDANPEWLGRAAFVYSNAWDHAFAPETAFKSWYDQLCPGGVLLLDHTKGQLPKAANALDPFGATLPVLTDLLRRIEGAEAATLELLDFTDNRDYRANVVLLWKPAA